MRATRTRPLGSLSPVRIPKSKSMLKASPTNRGHTTIIDGGRSARPTSRSSSRGSGSGSGLSRTPTRSRPGSRGSPTPPPISRSGSPHRKPRPIRTPTSPIAMPRISQLKVDTPDSRYSPSDVSVRLGRSPVATGSSRSLDDVTPSPIGSRSLASMDETGEAPLKVTFGTATDRGARPYQEDKCRVVNLVDWCKPDVRRRWRGPPILFAGMYDGHGGKGAVTFCHEELHKFVARHPDFPGNMQSAVSSALKRLEEHFLVVAKGKSPADVSGVCVVVAVIYGRTVTVGNIGDCRAVVISRRGIARAITKDHKPDSEIERARVERAGGSVSRRTASERGCCGMKEIPMGPFRVQPGGLAVARSVGDIRCKFPMYGGIPGTVISVPDVFVEHIDEGAWGIILATDGLWDHVKEDMLYKRATNAISKADKEQRDLEKYCNNHGKPAPTGFNRSKVAARSLVELSIEKCPQRAQLDNITCCVLLFD